MNRRERRTAAKAGAPARPAASATPHNIETLFASAVGYDRSGDFTQAKRLCQTILDRDPTHVPSLVLLAGIDQQAGHNRSAIRILRKALEVDGFDVTVHDTLAMAHQALGQRDEAAHHFRRAIECGLGGLEQLIKQTDVISSALARLRGAWPRRLTLAELLGEDGLDILAQEALLVSVLRSFPICDIELERFFMALRSGLLQLATTQTPPAVEGAAFELCCALAQQCFINEYVFAFSEIEADVAERLRDRVAAEIVNASPPTPFRVAVVATYFPLHTMPATLVSREWPQLVEDLITQQVRAPQAEAEERETIPALTPIYHDVSLAVQRQYEENPYPRWTFVNAVKPTTFSGYLREKLPFASPSGIPEFTTFDLLIAGCGTGKHPIERALLFPNARVLAIDLSCSSLAYARRKSREAGLGTIEYAQADILALGSLGRNFDMIEAVGVLHHLSEPTLGWRALLSLLRPGGFMAVGLYSAVARRSYTAIRAAISERGFAPTASGIRTCRQDLIGRNQIPDSTDFFTMSGCRDLLFNVMEHQFTIPQIKAFLAEQNITFLGFECSGETLHLFQQRHPDPAAIVDLDSWHEFELSQPRTFLSMYVFWVRKPLG
jgi:2-polyprenyl-3-methyl-5-hydroxy-6-metoxy-1,4-benzoquinol methylase